MILRIFLLLLAVLPAPALAWGAYGHERVAAIALAGLTPRARAEVRRILAGGAAVDTPGCPLVTFADASTWPDCVRGLGDRYGYSAAWHYQNIDVCKPFDIDAACANGDCVTAQIPRQLAIAADRRASAVARAEALAFVVHLVGDMHQPLHIGDRHDRGGNGVLAAYGAKAPERMNLHRIWDSDLAERALTEPPAITPQSPTRAERREWARGGVADWAREGWEISRTIVYRDGCADAGAGRVMVDEAYGVAARAPLRRQVEKAGVRLALLLNAAFAR